MFATFDKTETFNFDVCRNSWSFFVCGYDPPTRTVNAHFIAQSLFEIYQNNKENEFCKIFPNEFFGYTKVTVEQPLIEDGDIKTDKKGNSKPDTSKRDSERVLLSENVDEYYDREVKPHIPDSWMDRSKDKIGYEINFTKYFYKFLELRSLEEISSDLSAIDEEVNSLSESINV